MRYRYLSTREDLRIEEAISTGVVNDPDTFLSYCKESGEDFLEVEIEKENGKKIHLVFRMDSLKNLGARKRSRIMTAISKEIKHK